jgi:hypothetical protein
MGVSSFGQGTTLSSPEDLLWYFIEVDHNDEVNRLSIHIYWKKTGNSFRLWHVQAEYHGCFEPWLSFSLRHLSELAFLNPAAKSANTPAFQNNTSFFETSYGCLVAFIRQTP